MGCSSRLLTRRRFSDLKRRQKDLAALLESWNLRGVVSPALTALEQPE